MKYFARAGSLVGFEKLVTSLGGNPATLLRSVGLSPVITRTPEIYIPYTVLAELYHRTAISLDRADFGLLLGESQGLEVFGALGSAACLQPDMQSALLMMQQSLGFHARGVRFDINPEDESVILELGFDFEDQVDCTQLAAVSIALSVSAIAQLSGGKVSPTRVEFARPNCSALRKTRIHGAEMDCGSWRNAVHYLPELLDTSVAISKEVRQSLDAAWQSAAEGMLDLDLEDRLRLAIESLLPTGECQLPLVSQLLGVSPRVMQLRLSERGTSFETILRRSRERLAKAHLQHGNMSVTELALNLSYKDTSAFSRAFKSWTGASPRNWQQSSNSA
jgi:AraC-like DNA-binding protein